MYLLSCSQSGNFMALTARSREGAFGDWALLFHRITVHRGCILLGSPRTSHSLAQSFIHQHFFLLFTLRINKDSTAISGESETTGPFSKQIDGETPPPEHGTRPSAAQSSTDLSVASPPSPSTSGVVSSRNPKTRDPRVDTFWICWEELDPNSKEGF